MAETETPSTETPEQFNPLTTVLELSTKEFKRPQVEIDGVHYEMRAPTEMSVADMKVQKRLQAIIRGYLKKSKTEVEPSDDEFDEYISAVLDSVKMVTVGMSDEFLESLPAGMWTDLLQHYRSFRLAPDPSAVSTTS